MSEKTKPRGFFARGLHWPVIVVLILGGSVSMHLVILAKATGDPSFVIEKDYYEQATRWDATQEERRASEALGWKVDARARAVGPDLEVEIAVTDAAGRPIEGADVWVKGFAIARSAAVAHATLDFDDTRYRGRLDHGRPGLWDLDVEVRLHDQRFLTKKRVEAVR
jgi:nitrogen fixation protein FixH